MQITTSIFIERAIEVHGQKFEYSKVVYTNAHGRVKIVCPEHGEYEQYAHAHLSGKGCAACSGVRKHTVESFMQKAKEVHGDKYGYSNAEYKGNKTKLAITCPEHGVFEQVPNSHLSGRGCPRCAKTAYDKSKPGFVYLLLSGCGKYMKVGLTNKPKQRFSELRTSTPFHFVVLDVYSMAGELAPLVEKALHRLCDSALLKGFCGCTEWFAHDYDKEYMAHCVCTQTGKHDG